jgi:hypothetical protein
MLMIKVQNKSIVALNLASVAIIVAVVVESSNC